MTGLDRRSFLKLIGSAAPALLLPGLGSSLARLPARRDSAGPNIILLLFDAMSACNLSLYGYPRPTTPYLERFAERATVYHSHYSSGNYTIPGVASLLTGTYPWTHRAVNHSGMIRRDRIDQNLFRAMGGGRHRLAFPQSAWASFIVSQFETDLDSLMPSGAFSELDHFLGGYFPRDRNMATRALDDFVFKMKQPPVSLVSSTLERALFARDVAQLDQQGYPRGLPHNVNYPLYFRLEEVFDGLGAMLPDLPPPFLAYLHLLPPHFPYRPSRKFNSLFAGDGWAPPVKPIHRLSMQNPQNRLDAARRSYDEYIASVDAEFGRWLDAMDASGLLEDSYLIVTSDHGEMFERGEKAHSTPLLYDPVVHIPLIIASPGQRERRDIHSPTNAVDLLPTILGWAGEAAPAWCEGKPLPGQGGAEDPARATFTVEAKLSPALQTLSKATVAMRRGHHKLIHYRGYSDEGAFELYDLAEDAEEMNDLYPSRPAIADSLVEELLEAFHAADRPDAD